MCGPGYKYLLSFCAWNTNAQDYYAWCSNTTGGVDSYVPGSCLPTEICVDQGSPPEYQQGTALCVGDGQVISLTQDPATNATIGGETFSGISVGGTNDFVFEAVVTGTDSKALVFADSVILSAQSYTIVENVPVWETLPSGSTECIDCANLELQPIPVGTKRIEVNVVLEDVTAEALLHLELVTI